MPTLETIPDSIIGIAMNGVPFLRPINSVGDDIVSPSSTKIAVSD